ncbi:hypothetical protein X973_15730, partial [Piscirickettsia salmonis]
RRVVIAAERVHRHGLGPQDLRRSRDADGHVVGAVAGAGNGAALAAAAQAAGIQVERAELAAGQAARVVGAGAQVEARAGVQHQHAVARGQFDDGAVGGVDHLAVAVQAQACAMRVQQAVDAQVVARRQADAADLAAAGVDTAIDRQAAAIDADLDHARAHLVAHHQVALLELEAAGAGDAALVQSVIQA